MRSSEFTNRKAHHSKLNLDKEVSKFVIWMKKKLNLKRTPKVVLSMNTKEAQQGHHTGRHILHDDKIWIYAKNRNLVDILRTIAHEMTHVRQEELNMVKAGSSYPGSPIELLADMVAGKLIKVYGKNNPHIFE